jgi:hypothetical protein
MIARDSCYVDEAPANATVHALAQSSERRACAAAFRLETATPG